MAVLSDLVKTIAKVEHLDPAMVGLIARHIREDGLIATRGRGPSAAKMSLTDAANLLIGVNATSGGATHAARTVKKYRQLLAREFHSKSAGHPESSWGTLGDAIEQLLKGTVRGELAESLRQHLSPEFQEAFSRGDVHVDLRFRKSMAAAFLGMTTLPSSDAVEPSAPEPWTKMPPEILIVFRPPTAQKPPPASSKQPDRIEETAIGYPTLRAVGKLIG